MKIEDIDQEIGMQMKALGIPENCPFCFHLPKVRVEAVRNFIEDIRDYKITMICENFNDCAISSRADPLSTPTFNKSDFITMKKYWDELSRNIVYMTTHDLWYRDKEGTILPLEHMDIVIYAYRTAKGTAETST